MTLRADVKVGQAGKEHLTESHLWLQDVTEENAELALGVKANKGLIPAAATPTSMFPFFAPLLTGVVLV